MKNKEEKIIVNITDTKEQHLKGYMFDSLVYRYRMAQNEALISNIQNLMIERNLPFKEAENKVRSRQVRDLTRFIQILDEAIGEHD